MVGNGAEDEIVARLEEPGMVPLRRKLASIGPLLLEVDPERSILAAAAVVCAISMAAGGKVWL